MDSWALAGAGDTADRVTAISASTTNTLLKRLAGCTAVIGVAWYAPTLQPARTLWVRFSVKMILAIKIQAGHPRVVNHCQARSDPQAIERALTWPLPIKPRFSKVAPSTLSI